MAHRSDWLREPLLHFLLLGALIFAGHRLWRERLPEEHVIPITPALRAELGQRLSAELGRGPTGAELALALENWKAEEVLYREGLRLGLDQGDPEVRRRVAHKMVDLDRELGVTREPTAAELEAFLQQNLARYREPPRYDFEHVFAERGKGNAPGRARELLRRLVAQEPQVVGDDFDAGNLLEGRSLENLRQLFGEDFAERLSELEPGRWQLVESVHGVHVVRVNAVHMPAAPDIVQLRPRLERDWKLAQRTSSGALLSSELGRRYVFQESGR